MKRLIIILSIITLVLALAFASLILFQSHNPFAKTAPGNGGSGATDNSFPVSSGSQNTGNVSNNSSANSFGTSSPRQGSSASLAVFTAQGSLKRVSERAIGGAAIVNLKGTSTPVFMDRETGNLYYIDTDNETVSRLTGTVLPKIYQVYWGEDKTGSKLIARYLKDGAIENYSANLKMGTSTGVLGELTGAIINPNIYSLAVSPVKDKIFYLTSYDNSTAGLITDFNFKNQAPLFKSSYTSWVATWPNSSIIALRTKVGSEQEGYLYFLNIQTGKLNKVLGGLPGLNTLISPDGKKVIYSANDTGHSLHLFNVSSKTDLVMGLDTFAEKCVWAKDSKTLYCAAPKKMTGYPLDDWYAGTLSSDDGLWSLDTETGKLKQLYDPSAVSSKTKISIDGTNLFLNKKEDAVFLTNKKDGTLWLASLKNAFPTPSSSILPAKQATTSQANSSSTTTTSKH